MNYPKTRIQQLWSPVSITNYFLILPYRLEELLPYAQCTIIIHSEDTRDIKKYTHNKKQQQIESYTINCKKRKCKKEVLYETNARTVQSNIS